MNCNQHEFFVLKATGLLWLQVCVGIFTREPCALNIPPTFHICPPAPDWDLVTWLLALASSMPQWLHIFQVFSEI